MKQFLFFFGFILVLTVITAAEVEAIGPGQPRVIVQLPLGKLEGEERKSLNGKKFFAFEGVPYAAPPTGQNRFREPQELKKWTDTKLVNNKTIQCIQLSEFTAFKPPYKVEGDEDCLILNIYSPKLTKTANLDVIVFIHGGGFMFGVSYNNGPDYLLDEEVVYVSLNYRLGPLGFLSTEDEEVPGNMGLRDQIMALKFIKKHIRCFGGNPESVTLTGNSAGGASVHFHMLSPLSKGLFKRGISQSGTMLNEWVLVENSREKAEKLAASLNCSRSSLREAVSCLRTKPAEDVVAAVQDFLPWMYTPFSPFGVVVDSWARKPCLPEHPVRLIQRGRVQPLQWIVSHTNSEGLFPGADFYDDSVLDQIETRWNEILPNLLDFNNTVRPSLHDRVSQQIRHYYMGNKTVSKETYMDFIQIITDRLYVGDIVKSVQLHLENVAEASIQLYMFDYRGARSLLNVRSPSHSNEDFGASHIDDTAYVLHNFIDTSTTPRDLEMVKVMVKMFVSFARNGMADVGLEWPRATKERLHRLHVSGPEELRIDAEVFTNSSFWGALPIWENEKLFRSENDEMYR